MFVTHNMAWLNEQTFAREPKCWMKMFDLDQTWKAIQMQMLTEAAKRSNMLFQHDAG